MEHILDLDKQRSQLVQLYGELAKGNTILFLGAGASVGEKKYLSKQIIEYHEERVGKSYGLSDITKFVDVLSADATFNRDRFDEEVEALLRKYRPTEAHRIVTTIQWREIITTNYDLLIEQAYDENNSSHEVLQRLRVIKELRDYNYRAANDEVKYVKLNGCISDKRRYPLVFSTRDFKNANKYYKMVLQDLLNLSSGINFLSVGYSFTDDFARQLLERFDSYAYRQRRILYSVDPYPNENTLPYLAEQRVCVIRASFEEFFAGYKKWDQERSNRTAKRIGPTFNTARGSILNLPSSLTIQLNGVVQQLNEHFHETRPVSATDYYKGEEPNYAVILKHYDVAKRQALLESKDSILTLLGPGKTIIPIVFLTGQFGIGKSTFALRLIHELEHVDGLDVVAFDIQDFSKLRKEQLLALFGHTNANLIVLRFDEIEVESAFKALIDTRMQLSIEQLPEANILFLAPIRENILAKYKRDRDIKESIDIEVPGTLDDVEIDELLEKLMGAGLLTYRDKGEKNMFKQRIKRDFQSDSFIALLQLVSGGRHAQDLLKAYDELSKDAKNAFVYTALLHQHKLSIPASWLKQVVSMDWEEFEEKVIRAEGKGILIQEQRQAYGTDPDLYFRTKHPLIAQRLIQELIPSQEDQYHAYERIFKSVNFGQTNSRIIVDLIKGLGRGQAFSREKTDKLYDLAYVKLSDDPHYLLQYVINLQRRGTEANLKKALDILLYAEGLLPNRNHRFLHRRGVINFELAKISFEKEKELLVTRKLLHEARELFTLKQLLDTCSSYSYTDYIKMLLWELNKVEMNPEEEIRYQIQVQELFEVANRAVTEDKSRIDALREDYASYVREVSDGLEYSQHLDKLYEDERLRPYACILKYRYLAETKPPGCHEAMASLVEEMSLYKEIDEIVKFLFRYNGHRLWDPNSRVVLFEMSRQHAWLENKLPLAFYYFRYVAESYSHNFYYGRTELQKIRDRFWSLNPDLNEVWCDENGAAQMFEALVVHNDRERHKGIRVTSLQQTFRIAKESMRDLKVGQSVLVKLRFLLSGINAEIVARSPDAMADEYA